MVEINFSKYSNVNNWNYKYDSIIDKFLSDEKSDWYNLNINTDIINDLSDNIKKNADVFIVIGIGGSYIGSKAIIEALSNHYKKGKPEIIFMGNNLSSDDIDEVLTYIDNKKVYVNVISKSGNTLETIVTFDIILDYMKKKYKDFVERIIVTTNNTSGILLDYVKEYNFKHLILSDNLIGRYSVLSDVGLLPCAVAGINIKKLLIGANDCKYNLDSCYKYTIYRHTMYVQGINVESIDVFDSKLYYFTEWIKQLFNESQGKDNSGILTISTINPRDLHSTEQYYLSGREKIFSTMIYNNSKKDIDIKRYNKSLNQINEMLFNSVINVRKNKMNVGYIKIDEIDEYNLGYLIFFFEMSAMIGSYLLNVNYFDQPDVEMYKNILKNALNE